VQGGNPHRSANCRVTQCGGLSINDELLPSDSGVSQWHDCGTTGSGRCDVVIWLRGFVEGQD
jgi:hypothetical protein